MASTMKLTAVVLLLLVLLICEPAVAKTTCKVGQRKYRLEANIDDNIEEVIVLDTRGALVSMNPNLRRPKIIVYTMIPAYEKLEQVLVQQFFQPALVLSARNRAQGLKCIEIELPKNAALDRFIVNHNSTVVFDGNISLPYLELKVIQGNFLATRGTNITADFVSVNITGIGNVELGSGHVIDELEVNLEGWGNVTVHSRVANALIHLEGTGDVKLGPVQDSLIVNLHGNGSVVTAGGSDLKIFGEAQSPNGVTFLTGSSCEVQALGGKDGFNPCNSLEVPVPDYTIAGRR